MEIIVWSLIFIVSLAALIKAASWLTAGTQKLFAGGFDSDLVIVSIGAALPETAAAAAAVLQGRPELAVAIVIGSSVANILLVVGISALAAKTLLVKKDHIDADLPLFAASVAFFYFIVRDGQVEFFEGMLMLVIFFVYSIYILSTGRRGLTPRDIITPGLIGQAGAKLVESVGTRIEKSLEKAAHGDKYPFWKSILAIIGSTLVLVVAAHFTVESLAGISEIVWWVPATVLAMIVLAAAAALPEIFNGLAVIRKRRYEIALGNVFAAATVNLFLVTGMAALFAPLPLDGATLMLGLPFLVVSAGLLLVSANSGKINFGQGLMYLFLYLLFFVKLFNLF